MRSFAIILSCWCLLLGPSCALATADGGKVVLVEQGENYRISVFVSPDPLRAGPIDISVLLQDADSGQTINKATINVSLVSQHRPGTTIHASATQDAATNKLLRAALMELPEPGWWDFEIACVADQQDSVKVHFAMEAGPQLPQWMSVWPWFTWPFGIVLLFGIHQLLVARKFNVSRRVNDRQ